MVLQRRIHRAPLWQLLARRWLATMITTLALATLVFGLGGFAWQYAARARSSPPPGSPPEASAYDSGQDWSIPFYRTVQLFLLNSGAEDNEENPDNWLLALARIAASALFLVVSSAVILQVLDDVRRLPGQLTRKDHVVICGMGQVGLQLLDDLDAAGRAREVVVVEANAMNPWLEYARSMGATVIVGDSTKASTLIEARAPQAREVFVVTGDEGGNLEVTAELGMLLAGQSRDGQPLQLYVHILDTSFATTLRPYCTVLHDTPDLNVNLFNVPRTSAARLITHQLWPHAPQRSDEVAHFVLMGFGPMGQALAVQLAQLAHFPNRKRSRFTIADVDIQRQARVFLARHGRFTSWSESRLGVDSFAPESDAWDWNLGPLPDSLRIDSDEAIQYVANAEFAEIPSGRSDEPFARALAGKLAAEGVRPVIFVCGQQDRDNFESAVQLRDQLACFGLPDTPIFVWLPRQPALAETLARTPDGNFFPFGECRNAASYDEITAPMRESLGRKIHEDYERQRLEQSNALAPQRWSDLRDDLRESNRVAADHLIIKLAALGLRLRRSPHGSSAPVEFDTISQAQAHILAEMEHYRWVAERLLAGWRYAPASTSDAETAANKARKLNPNLVAWSRLGPERQKDFDQIRTVLRECQNDHFGVERIDIQAHRGVAPPVRGS